MLCLKLIITMKTINLKGKQYATFDGVLDEAHKQGLVRIETEVLQSPNKEAPVCVVRAFVKTGKGEYYAHGDATPQNVGRMIVPHIIRMAETRAIGRALRFATNAPTLAEELDGENVVQSSTPAPAPAKAQPVAAEFTAMDKLEVTMEENEGAVNKFMRHKGMIGLDSSWRDAAPDVLKKIMSHEQNFFQAVRNFA